MIKLISINIFIFIFTIIIGKFIIKNFLSFQLDQKIREDGPKNHLKKIGTPTMGGIIFIIPITIISIIYLADTLLATICMLAYTLLGINDDLSKRIMKKGKGLSVKKKFLIQCIIGFILSFFVILTKGGIFFLGFSNKIVIFCNIFIYIALLILYFVSITNAVNLTDGLDGLAISVTIPILMALLAISLMQINYNLAFFIFSIIIIFLGFLIFNFYPAKIFMGDTGSMALGGLIAGISIILQVELLMIIIGFVYMVETFSVILQVLYFKITRGRRLFKMSPLHHHFELLNKKEPSIVYFFTTISFFSSIIGFAVYCWW